MPDARITVRIAESEKVKLDTLARKREVKMSDIVRIAIRRELEEAAQNGEFINR